MDFYIDNENYNIWLRHNCKCNLCIHPMSKELLTRPYKLTPAQLMIRKFTKDDFYYQIEWMDGHKSCFNLEDLLSDRNYSLELHEFNRLFFLNYPSIDMLNEKKLVPIIAYDFSNVMKNINEHGFCWLKNFGLDNSLLIKLLAENNFPLFESHFGRYEDIQPKEFNTTNSLMNDQLGYTYDEIDLHTDQPFLENPPPLQALHCITKASTGGENYITDGKLAWEILKNHNNKYAYLLSSVKITFDRNQKNFKKKLDASIIESDKGEFISVRSSYFTLAPFNVPNNNEYYKAYNNYHYILDMLKVKVELEEGDVLLYDNHRMLHARGAFTGKRLMKGTYHIIGK